MNHRMGPGMDVILMAKKLKELSKEYISFKRHREVLAAFAGKRDGDSWGFYFVSFKYLAKELGYTESEIRRSARYLARKGLTEYAKGLFNEDGGVAGAGHAATSFGSAVSRLLEDENETNSV